MKEILSAFPYYGGKARMNGLICSLLDYDNTDVYIECFGGGCRTLMNKKRHLQEVYNDFGYGLTTFMGVMADELKTDMLIEMLYDSPPNKEQFQELVLERMEAEDRLNTATDEQVKSLAVEGYKEYKHQLFKELGKAVREEKYGDVIETIDKILNNEVIVLGALVRQQYEHYLRLYKDYWELVGEKYNIELENAKKAFEIAWNDSVDMESGAETVKKIYQSNMEIFARDWATNKVHESTNDLLATNEKGGIISDVEMAFIIFQLYYASRDGMGVAWSDEKNANVKNYYNAVRNLRNVSDRIKDVVILQVDALDLVEKYRTYKGAMIYLDPSYLKPDDEYKNLGGIYRRSYGYEEHEKLLRVITKSDTRAKILISNYDVELYNTYLSDWGKTYYKTFTGVGSKKGNRRTEVLWKNY